MKWKFWRGKEVRADVVAARERRLEAEARLAADNRNVIVPLREMLHQNHITADVADLILKTYRGGDNDTSPSGA